MKILPVAFDSFGARSMATYLETKDVKIFIDPAVALSPDRYSLPPHKVEIDRHKKLWDDIKKWVALSDVVIITHYHYDHHNPNEPDIFIDKELLIKDPHKFINESQKNRAAFFLNQIEGKTRTLQIADGASFIFGGTKIQFSHPVFHGQSNRLGYVLMVLVEEDSKFIFSSDIQGPLIEDPVDFILKNEPETLFLDGPSTYLVGSHYKKSDMDCAFNHLKRIINGTMIKNLIIDHHLLRDLNWYNFVDGLKNLNNHTVIQSAARFRGYQEDLLEAKRKDFYEGKCQYVNNYE
uniref:MBL fold metallo-hydrolase n=1 Tax=candidate division WOR-3 bacterium TaxID=2052148 RepID=A0A7V1EH48_UNCW3